MTTHSLKNWFEQYFASRGAKDRKRFSDIAECLRMEYDVIPKSVGITSVVIKAKSEDSKPVVLEESEPIKKGPAPSFPRRSADPFAFPTYEQDPSFWEAPKRESSATFSKLKEIEKESKRKNGPDANLDASKTTGGPSADAES